MKLNEIDFNKLNKNELKYIIHKYKLSNDTNNLSRDKSLQIIKTFIISKMNKYKHKSSIKRSSSYNSINNNTKQIKLNKTYSDPVTNKETNNASYKTYNSTNEINNNISINKELSNKSINYDNINMYPPVKRLVAIGDIHGDLKITLDALKLAVTRMLPGGPLAKKQLTKLKIYSGSTHPHSSQNPKIIDLSKLNSKNLIRN